MKRLTLVLAFILFFSAAFSALNRIYSNKFLATTGEARWLWAHHRMSSNDPVAFFAARDFTLPEKRYYTRVKVAADPEYTLFINGREVTGRLIQGDPTLDLYDVSQLVTTGRNRIVVAVRAPQGVGGVLASIDIAPEVANWVVTDASWKIYRWWSPDILLRDVPAVYSERPLILGPPPIGRWNYLTLVPRTLVPPPSTTAPPRESFPTIARLPAIRTRGGIAFAVVDRTRATAFDFGFTRGRVRFIADRAIGRSRKVQVRFAYLRSELGTIEWNLRPIVFAPGETVVTTPEPHSFRYVMVFARDVRAEVAR